uniref:Uncharacterized protein n=1 Tax=Arundo donax TaxID=35708 RepID=A0A0A8ZUB9_ARUDO
MVGRVMIQGLSLKHNTYLNGPGSYMKVTT